VTGFNIETVRNAGIAAIGAIIILAAYHAFFRRQDVVRASAHRLARPENTCPSRGIRMTLRPA
jgi:hypothetical protein